MATISSWDMVEEIIRKNGRYEDDPQIVRIVEYNNVFDGRLAWGLIYADESLQRYHAGATIGPRTIWDLHARGIETCAKHRPRYEEGDFCITVDGCHECMVDCRHPNRDPQHIDW